MKKKQNSKSLTAMKAALLTAIEEQNWGRAVLIADKMLESSITDKETFYMVMAAGIDGNDISVAKKAAVKYRKQFSGMSGQDYFYFGRIAYMENDFAKAEEFFQYALTDKNLTGWYRGAVESIYATLMRRVGCPQKAVEHYRESIRYKDLQHGKALEYSNLLFNMQYLPLTEEKLFHAAKGYNELFADVQPYTHDRHKQHDRIRIGYISPDFRFHVVAFFCYAMLHDYDKKKFAVFCYTNCVEDDASREFRSMVDVWRNVRGMNYENVAALIYEDEVDILMDLAGHTANNLLPVLAYRPAPIQISGIGYLATTGLKTVDYFLVDKYTAPREQAAYFTETLLRMEHSHFCYMWHDSPQEPGELPYRRNGFITFGSLNNFTKINDKVLRLWKKLLDKVPKSRLYLKTAIFNHEYGRKLVEKRLEKVGISLKRVIMKPYEGIYLYAYKEIDIALDTFPYTGGGTTCDALYMGVPVITLAGGRHNSRFGYSLLMNLKMEYCCAFSEVEYVEKAVALSGDIGLLENLRQNLRLMMEASPIMQPHAYMRELEDKYISIYEKYWENNTPQPMPSWLRVDKLCASIRKMALAGKPALALAFLKQLEKEAQFGPEEKWRLFENYYICYQKMQDWTQFQRYILASINSTAGQPIKVRRSHYSDYLFNAHYFPDITEDEFRHAHLAYNELWEQEKLYVHEKERHRRHKKIRIGYLAETFTENVVSLFSIQLLAAYSRDKFEVYCYSTAVKSDELSEFIKSNVGGWTELDLCTHSAKELAQKIYEDEIDILFDLHVHSSGGLTLAVAGYRPAPIQIAGIGYMATSGLKEMDYFLGDYYLDPPGLTDSDFSETIVRLKGSHFCYTPSEMAQRIGHNRSKHEGITFGSFNNFAKLSPRLLAAWAKIMRQVPDSRLIMRSSVDDEMSRKIIVKKMEIAGIPQERVLIESPDRHYYERYLDIDIMLDSYPYTGGGTTCDALYMGTPVITRYGKRHGTRFSYSLLKNIGLEELAADTWEGYVDRAVMLAGERELLKAIQMQLPQMMKNSPVMNARGYVHEVEALYENMWNKWLRE